MTDTPDELSALPIDAFQIENKRSCSACGNAGHIAPHCPELGLAPKPTPHEAMMKKANKRRTDGICWQCSKPAEPHRTRCTSCKMKRREENAALRERRRKVLFT